MTVESHNTFDVDPGLFTLMLLLRLRGIDTTVDAMVETARQQCGPTAVGVLEMTRCANALGFKARMIPARWKRLAGRLPFPARLLS